MITQRFWFSWLSQTPSENHRMILTTRRNFYFIWICRNRPTLERVKNPMSMGWERSKSTRFRLVDSWEIVVLALIVDHHGVFETLQINKSFVSITQTDCTLENGGAESVCSRIRRHLVLSLLVFYWSISSAVSFVYCFFQNQLFSLSVSIRFFFSEFIFILPSIDRKIARTLCCNWLDDKRISRE